MNFGLLFNSIEDAFDIELFPDDERKMNNLDAILKIVQTKTDLY